MAYKSLESQAPSRFIALGQKDKESGKMFPNSIEGYYIGYTSRPSKFDPSKLSYTFLLKVGNEIVGVFGKTHIDRQMLGLAKNTKPAKLGAMTQITNTHTTKDTGRTPMQVFIVEQDLTKCIDIDENYDNTPPSKQVQDQYSTSPKEAYDSNDEEDEQIDDYAAEEASQKVALAAAERKAKVAALLKGNKSSTNNK